MINLTYTANSVFGLTTNPGSTKKLPLYLSDAHFYTAYIIKSVGGEDEERRVIERNKVNGQEFFLKKGDKIKMNVPEGSKRLLDIKSTTKLEMLSRVLT